MMKLLRFVDSRLLLLVLLFMAIATTGNAQYLRTSYFMDGAQYRLQLNPALAPSRGYIHLPGVSQTNASLRTNSLGIGDVVDVVKNADDADYFMTDKFMDKLVDVNKAQTAVGSDLFAVGNWHGKGFFSMNISLKVDGNVSIPRELFTFMRDMNGMNTNDYSDFVRHIGEQELNVNAYAEIGVGYTRLIGDRLSIGGRVKGLLGVGNANLKIHSATIQTNLNGVDPDIDWSYPRAEQLDGVNGTASIDVDADLVTSFKGLELKTNQEGYIDDVSYKTGKMGLSGFGAAFDLGLSYDVTQEFSLSAAVTDLGFIRWTKGSTQKARAITCSLNFDTNAEPDDLARFADVVGGSNVLNWDMLRLTPDRSDLKSRNTTLASTMALGAEYRLANDKVSLGALFTNRFAKPENDSELTFSVGVHPSTLLDFAVSYSPIACGGSSFGVAMKLGPLFIGTDYMYLGNDTKCCNALVGLSIPLGKQEE